MSSDNPDYPDHLRSSFGTVREFRSKKRQEARVVRRALVILRRGCAFVPEGPSRVEAATREIDALIDAMSIKRWGQG